MNSKVVWFFAIVFLVGGIQLLAIIGLCVAPQDVAMRCGFVAILVELMVYHRPD